MSVVFLSFFLPLSVALQLDRGEKFDRVIFSFFAPLHFSLRCDLFSLSTLLRVGVNGGEGEFLLSPAFDDVSREGMRAGLAWRRYFIAFS